MENPSRMQTLALLGSGLIAVAGVALIVNRLINARRNRGPQAPRLHPFLEAAKSGNIRTLKSFISQVGFDVDAEKDNEQSTALILACRGASLEAIQLLLDAGANAKTQNQYGFAPLHTCVHFKGPFDAINLLLQRGAEVNKTDNNGWTAVTMACALGDTKAAKLLIERGGIVNHTTLANQTALLIASCNGHTQTVRLLLDNRADPTIRTKAAHESPLIFAVANGHMDIINMLLDAHPNLMNLGTVSGVLPIHFAVQFARKDIIKLLASRGADINAKKSDGASVISIVADSNQSDLLPLLLDLGAKLDGKSNYGATPLHVACCKKRLEVFTSLIKANHPIHIFDNDGLTPLHALCSSFVQSTDITHDGTPIEVFMANTLLDKGAQVNAGDRVGGTALHHCICRKGNELLLRFLLAHGADVGKEDSTGWTALHLLKQMYPNKSYEDILVGHIREQHPKFLDNFDPQKPRRESAYIDPSAPMLTEAERQAVLGGDTSMSAIAKGIRDGKYKNIIVLTGAGISTNSGIPDFRSKDKGLYANAELQSKLNVPTSNAFSLGDFMENPVIFYRVVQEVFLPVIRGKFKPTACHYFISLLNKKGLLLRNYTQNIDTLEAQAGIPAEKMVEAHGSFSAATCMSCHKPCESMEYFWEQIEASQIPVCAHCRSARVKPNVVFFGEGLPARYTDLQVEDFPKCDLVIVMGTSLSVYPFAGLVNKAPPTTPRMLLNQQGVGPFKNIPHYEKENGELVRKDGTNPSWRDVCFLGDIDEGIWELSKLLGWEDELKGMVSQSK